MSLPTKFVNFIASSWEIPAHVLETIFMETDSMEERNNVIFNECFVYYLELCHDITNFWTTTDKRRTALWDKYFDSFLAETVKMAYLYEE